MWFVCFFVFVFVFVCKRVACTLLVIFLPYLPSILPLSLALSLCLSHYSVSFVFVLGVIYNLDLVNIVCSQTNTYTYSVVCV